MTRGNGAARSLPAIPARPIETPEANLPAAVGPSIGDTWVTPELREERRRAVLPFIDPEIKQQYRGAIDEMIARGIATVEPQGARILVQALIPEDAADSALWQPEYDARHAIMYRVVAVGPGCARWWKKQGYTPEQYLKPGDAVHILTTVADRLSSRNKAVRFWSCKVKWIAARINIKGDATQSG